MALEINDIVSLSDKNDYVVTGNVEHNGETYFFIVDVNNLENTKFCKLSKKVDRAALIETHDKKLIQELVALFAKKYSKPLK